ncbi:TPA: hypothetical protein ACGIK9_002828 [Acinetobacter baumannii]|uniref:hypothetical protein n=1 Tax=Acinetobacter baumannii TaxID=470 RepID=UPI00338E5448
MSKLSKFFLNNDSLQTTTSHFKPTLPLEIQVNGEIIKVIEATRTGVKFSIKCLVFDELDLIKKEKIYKFSGAKSSYIRLVKKFGLSQDAKLMYKHLEVYDKHFSEQANLTTLRWTTSKLDNCLVALSDIGKDLLFQGSKIQNLCHLKEIGLVLYMATNNRFVICYQNNKNEQEFKISTCIDELMECSDKSKVYGIIEDIENYWDFEYVY